MFLPWIRKRSSSQRKKTPTKHHINDNEATFCYVIYCVEAPFKYLALKQKAFFVHPLFPDILVTLVVYQSIIMHLITIPPGLKCNYNMVEIFGHLLTMLFGLSLHCMEFTPEPDCLLDMSLAVYFILASSRRLFSFARTGQKEIAAGAQTNPLRRFRQLMATLLHSFFLRAAPQYLYRKFSLMP